MFLKENRDGKIKDVIVAGGNRQRDFIPKEDSSSPAVATKAVILSCIIDAEEKRNVVVIDTPNAFIQTRVKNENKMVAIKIRLFLVELILEIYPELYGPFVTTDKKCEKVISLKCINDIYGTMFASLLYYKIFLKTLKSTGFQLNPYHLCVEKRLVNYKHQTIFFHVDGCKLSHQGRKVNK